MEPICKLKDIYKALYNFEKEFSENSGITINEGMVLCSMKDDKPKTASELSDFVGLSNCRVSKIITSVEDKGFIVREMGKKDKRQMIFTLTNEGKTKIEEMQSQPIDFKSLAVHFFSLMEE